MCFIVCLWSPYVIGQTIYIFILSFVIVALCNRGAIIFLPCDFYLLSSFFLSSPNLNRRELDVYHTSTYGAVLVRI